ncbi:hypothetical protein CcaverHIS002_0700500 [Cutaneotrichosporon cavernicola]|uniref:Uncharacterized protein n=1 Tax=Cutaneotrichosporon cavernicola TaxID=279322 RepID=A0AA48L9M5_9TREE|nr:uncharacterized protein CcaverHIS019_0700510 [Cutaneotrichosporon cavernicola]BEI86704.1 hypothetical protein CcaverHIS002_0700500 [Cutaneotrichosporon cavernicola]BEI94479.1 hypothetical protein CcaverHIS019_0700510 [Cutaneotrichosporon cavernicola]BEJ02255.1 hypothetical protein CcaverHIS631_0700500 [Cutaneotrichosporon cavernicola]BEJ10014.1 hypothetical protein CcaverHIS641_0700490 [Cutaneotrichosporon cavernicola]
MKLTTLLIRTFLPTLSLAAAVPLAGRAPRLEARQAAQDSVAAEFCTWDHGHMDCFDTSEKADAVRLAYATGQCLVHHDGSRHGNCTYMPAATPVCGEVILGKFNMPMHIASVFIVLIISALGVYMPTIAGWFVKNPNGSKSVGHLDAASFGREYGFWGNVFFLARHFGTGVIISTAFVHLLYHGFLMWNDKCHGTLLFAPVAPTIAMVGALITFALDFTASHAAEKRFGAGSGLTSSTPAETPDISHTEKDMVPHNGCCPDAEAAILAWQNKELWRVLLLEAGIIFHSVMIGVTLGADSSPSWTTLFIVIIFHQFFEGAALGARLALLHWLSRWRSFLQASMFMIVTPIGIAIGIGVRQSFSANGRAALISIGILDSTSAGILLYTAFKLLAADFVDGPLKNANKKSLFASLFSLFLGILSMTILGRWV